jgi:hypothetical protein
MAKLNRLIAGAAVVLALLAGCTKQPPSPEPTEGEEEETLARTEFTSRIENFFEYALLKEKKPSFFRIHLTDLSDGSPVAQAQVTLEARRPGSSEAIAEATARVGKVTGIYVADLTLPTAGEYDVVFHIKNDKLDETMVLSGFKVE